MCAPTTPPRAPNEHSQKCPIDGPGCTCLFNVCEVVFDPAKPRRRGESVHVRPTRWLKCFREEGVEGLSERSSHPAAPHQEALFLVIERPGKR